MTAHIAHLDIDLTRYEFEVAGSAESDAMEARATGPMSNQTFGGKPIKTAKTATLRKALTRLPELHDEIKAELQRRGAMPPDQDLRPVWYQPNRDHKRLFTRPE